MGIGSAYPLRPDEVPALLPAGSSIRRFCQVSNGANTNTITANNFTVLQLNGDGTNNDEYNVPEGYGSVDYVNNWFDVSNCHRAADLTARVTVSNNNTGAVTNANIGLRLIPDKSNPGVFIDAPGFNLSFNTQSQFTVTGYHGGVEAVQVIIRTTTNENVRCHGVYMAIDDVLQV